MLDRDNARAHDQEFVSNSRDSGRTAAASYRELFQIGRGGFATISVALAQGIEGFSKLVVLKTLREELVFQPGATKMFLDEARLLARMNHPNIVQVYEVFRRRTSTVIAMEYVDGQPLTNILARCRESETPLRLELGLFIVTKILAALHYAHTLCDFAGDPLGLIHRDVSPHNVMVAYDGQVKLLDFGIAKLALLREADETLTGMVKGKITYMAPEQFTGPFDHRADIFAVGVMLWELATRRRYWARVPDPSIMACLISGELPHLFERLDIDDDLAKICDKSLSHDVERRYATAAAMQQDLERYLTARGIVVSPAAIGQFVGERCSEARKAVKEAIRTQLSELGLRGIKLADNSWAKPDPPRSKERKLLRRGLAVAAFALVASVLVHLVLSHSSAQPCEVAAVGSAPPNGSATAQVRLRARAQPAGAIWYLDGNRLGIDPLDIRIPRDGAAHTLRAEAEGHVPFLRAVRIEADLDVTAALARKPSDTGLPLVGAPPSGRKSVPSRYLGARPEASAPALGSASVLSAAVAGSAPTNARKSPVAAEVGDPGSSRAGTRDHERRFIDPSYPGDPR